MCGAERFRSNLSQNASVQSAAYLCVWWSKDINGECRRTQIQHNPNSHVYRDGMLWVKTDADAMDACGTYADRRDLVNRSPCASYVFCETCAGLCKPPAVDFDMSGLPCTSFSSSGNKLGKEDKIVVLHLKWHLEPEQMIFGYGNLFRRTLHTYTY